MCTPCPLRMVQNSNTKEIGFIRFPAPGPKVMFLQVEPILQHTAAYYLQGVSELEGLGSATFKASFECGQIELGTPFHHYFHLICRVVFSVGCNIDIVILPRFLFLRRHCCWRDFQITRSIFHQPAANLPQASTSILWPPCCRISKLLCTR